MRVLSGDHVGNTTPPGTTWSTPEPSRCTRYTPAAVNGVAGRVVVVVAGLGAVVLVVAGPGGTAAARTVVVVAPPVPAVGFEPPAEVPAEVPVPSPWPGSATTPTVVLVEVLAVV